MKLYKFNYHNEIEECEVVKETKKTFVYCHPNREERWTVFKNSLDKPMNYTSRNVVATSREKLIENGLLTVNESIAFYTKQLHRLQEERNNILKLSNK